MSLRPDLRGAACYGLAGIIGLAAMFAMLPLGTILGTGGLWPDVGRDAAVSLTGHLAFQAPGWHWPLLTAPDLVWPEGRSIALTDSNPLMSLLAKLLAGLAGHPVNLLGCWLGLCWVLQPVCAVYALRGLRPAASIEATVVVAVLALLCPAWLMRHNHVNLLGHFLLLAALGLAIRMMRTGRSSWWPAAGLLTAAVLVHPYLYVFAAILLAAPAIAQAFTPSHRVWQPLAAWVVVCAIPVAVLFVLSGALGVNGSGYGYYSMNLLSPIWPQRSGLFGPDLPILDATGGQYEGFNYQGAGVLLLALFAGILLRRRPVADPAGRRQMRAVLVCLAALSLLALSPHVYAGNWTVLRLPLQPWRQIFGAVQSSGRAFWAVGYALMIGTIACIDARLARPARLALLVTALALQLADTAPLRADSERFFAGGTQLPPPFAMPADATLLRIVPACDAEDASADLLRLLATRRRMHLADMRMARPPGDLACAEALSDGLETPLTPGEMRVFLPSALAGFRQDALGPGAACSFTEPGIVCRGFGADPSAGPIGPPGPIIATLSSSAAKPGSALSFGWRTDASGIAWSDCPRATLLFRLPDPPPAAVTRLALDIDALAATAGGQRSISIQLDNGAPQAMQVSDMQHTRLTLMVPVRKADLPVRIVFDIPRPVNPGKRGISAPVRRAGLRLFGVSMAAAQD